MAVPAIRRLLARGAFGGMLAILASGLGSVALAADHSVDIAGFAFSPQAITIAVGDTITWANADAQGHTATADDGSFDTGTIPGNTAKSATFSTAGTFAYHCRIHPTMTATLVVAAAPPATDSAGSETPAIGRAPSAVLALAALAGLLIARRRFAPRAAEATIGD